MYCIYRKETEFEESKRQLDNQHKQELAAVQLELENQRNKLVSVEIRHLETVPVNLFEQAIFNMFADYSTRRRSKFFKRKSKKV